MTWYVNPVTVWILNTLGVLLDTLRLGPSLDPDRLCRLAVRRTGLHDFGPDDYRPALSLACRSFSEDARLSFFGRLIARDVLSRALISRLRWAKLHRDNDPRLQTALNRPIIIVGLPRSGTTLVHRLLSELPGLRPLYTWELGELLPAPSSSPARRRRGARARIQVLRRLAPELDIKHLLDADQPEEEVSLFDASFWTPTFWRFGMVRQYLHWYLSADPLPGYRMYADMLRVLQAEQPDRRFILKMPNHTGYVDAIRAVIPSATIIQTHRDPVPVVASYASLMHSVHRIAAADWDAHQAGRDCLRLWHHHATRNIAARAQLPAADILDVRFSEVVGDLEGVIRRILDVADHPVPDDLSARVARHRTRTGPRHTYDLEDYGLSESEVTSSFSSYQARFL